MRPFNDVEKKFLKIMVNSSASTKLKDLLFDSSFDSLWCRSDGLYVKAKKDQINSTLSSYYDRLMEIYFLLKYLEENRYISFYNDEPIYPVQTKEQCFLLTLPYDLDVYYRNHFFKSLFITEELRNMVNSGFKSEEDVKFQETISLAHCSLIISFVATLLSFFSLLISK